MVWMFTVLSLTAICYTAHIILEHVRHIGALSAQILRFQEECVGLEIKIRDQSQERELAKNRIVDVEHSVKELQLIVTDLVTQIGNSKKKKEHRGKYRVEE
ncbi:MAG: hypothetical protein O2954_16460 [bacterium]|nr:hypothetical protein [bacterium]